MKTTDKSDQSVDVGATKQSTSSQSNSTNVVSCFSNDRSQVLLSTALVNAEAKNGTYIVLRSLLDQGSQVSFITESAVQLLRLQKILTKGFISGLGGDSESSLISNSMVFVKFRSRVNPNFVIEIKAYVLKKLTSLLPERQISSEVITTISSVELADPSFGSPSKIELLLGAEIYCQILLEGLITGSPGLPVAQNTKFGWILSGKVNNEINHRDTSSKNVASPHVIELNENETLRKFWELESQPSIDSVGKFLSPEEQKCKKLFAESTYREESGRYVVKLPFKTDDPQCKNGGSKEIALKRFLSLERRLIKDPGLKKQYSEVIKEYLDLNHMEIVNDCNKDGAVYLPHHAVVRHDKTTSKVRVVFDASCIGTNGVSLNNELMVGPSLQPELRHIIMHWRCFSNCLVADIVKMYRQIRVADDDIHFQRILWRENPDADIQHLRHLRVTFGTASAPYLAVRVLQQLAQDEGNEFPVAKERVMSDFYMDDMNSGFDNLDEGLQIYKFWRDLGGRDKIL